MKSNRLLGLLTFGKRSKALLVGYKVTLRQLLEYACQVWNPHQAYLVEKLERVQRNVTRWVPGKDTSDEETNKSFKLQSLRQWIEFLGLVQLFKFNKGNFVSNINDYMSFSNCRRTRNSHNYKLFKPYCRTDIFKNSFWNRHIDNWNNLRASIADLESVNTLKKSLKEDSIYKLIYEDIAIFNLDFRF